MRDYIIDLKDRYTVLNKDNHEIPVVISIPHSGLLLTKEMNDNLVDDLSQYSHGNIGKALALVNNKNFINMRKEIFDLLEKID